MMNRESLEKELRHGIDMIHIHRPLFLADGPGGVRVHVKPRQDWSLLLFEAPGTMEVHGERVALRAGKGCLIPPGVPRDFHYPVSSRHRVLNFNWARPENGKSWSRPLVCDLGRHFRDYVAPFDDAMGLFPSRPDHARVKAWNLLWDFCAWQPATGAAGVRPRHPALTRAVLEIQDRLGEPLRMGELAGKAGVSPNQFTRLFRAEYGMTAVAFLRKQRVSLAVDLLQNTDLPIRQIAQQVGIPDPHLFNKTIRRACGSAPRGVRRKSPG